VQQRQNQGRLRLDLQRPRHDVEALLREKEVLQEVPLCFVFREIEVMPAMPDPEPVACARGDPVVEQQIEE
jgi:hypothetical protein